MNEAEHKDYMRGLEVQRESEESRNAECPLHRVSYPWHMDCPECIKHAAELKIGIDDYYMNHRPGRWWTGPIGIERQTPRKLADAPKMPDIHEPEGYEGLYWMGSAEVYAYRDEMVAWADERVRVLAEALREALSVASSVSMSRDRRIERDGCVLYAQTEEWCKWAEDEVAPKLRAAIANATGKQ